MSRGEDRHPPINPSQVLLFATKRPGRLHTRKSCDDAANSTFGDAIVYKAPDTTRFMFQNVKGLTYNQSGDDYNYYLSSMISYSIDVFGMTETNSGWQHHYVQSKFKQCLRRQLYIGKTSFGSPTQQVDLLEDSETFQAGSLIQVVVGSLTTTVFGDPIHDSTGLGRWCGFTFIGKAEQKLSVITGYRTCKGSVSTSPLGSTFHREYAYYRNKGIKNPQPRTEFLKDLALTIRNLQQHGHAILLMMDANSTLTSDNKLTEFIESHDLWDLHSSNPAPSTYIGSSDRRIDYIFGCSRTRSACTRQGTLSYFEGPQSDHRSLYVDLDLRVLLSITNITGSLKATQPQRWLRSGNPESVEIRILTAWDEDQGHAMLAAESVLATRPKKYQWSPRLRNAGIVYRYWKLRLREVTHHEDYSSTFLRWERQIQEYDPSFTLSHNSNVTTIPDIRKQLNQAKKHLRKLQKTSTQSRVKCYEELLDAYEPDANPATKQESQRRAKIVSRTIKTEAIKSMYQKIRQTVKPSDHSGLAQLQIPRDPTYGITIDPGQVHTVLEHTPSDQLVWDTIINREDIERHLLSFNREAFRAAAESPCGRGVIHDALLQTSLSSEVETCLEGEIPDSWDIDNQLLREFLASFHIPSSVLETGPINLEIKNADIMKGFKSWKETTTTSPSGCHRSKWSYAIVSIGCRNFFRTCMHLSNLCDFGISDELQFCLI
ncbi:hypothetical protein MHU86_18504 [Fragilaria crotonensis]|nr:hypothetical protein MHU86_18504 [Fragilaria crotonensis]